MYVVRATLRQSAYRKYIISIFHPRKIKNCFRPPPHRLRETFRDFFSVFNFTVTEFPLLPLKSRFKFLDWQVDKTARFRWHGKNRDLPPASSPRDSPGNPFPFAATANGTDSSVARVMRKKSSCTCVRGYGGGGGLTRTPARRTEQDLFSGLSNAPYLTRILLYS